MKGFARTQTQGGGGMAFQAVAAAPYFLGDGDLGGCGQDAHAPFLGGRYIWLRRGCVGVWPLRLWWLAGAALFLGLGGCAGGGNLEPAVAQVYRAYDARVSRELVAGHDDLRGSYVEVRFAPRGIPHARETDGKAVVPRDHRQDADATAAAVVRGTEH